MSPRIIHLPLPGRDRRHYVRELRLAEQAHREVPGRVEEAYRAAHRLACHEWSVRQFIGGPAEPSPRIVDAIAGGCELLEVRCRPTLGRAHQARREGRRSHETSR